MSPTTMLDPAKRAPSAFGRAMVSAQPALRRHALRLTNDQAAADDLVQDTFARAWGARERFQSGTNMNAWLFRIARNAFLSGLRRTRRQVPWDPDKHERRLVQGASQEEVLYARDLRAAVSRLTPDQRDVLVRVMHDEMSMAAVAGELGVAVGTVKSRISRARASMLAYVIEDGATIQARADPPHGDESGTAEVWADELDHPSPQHTPTRYEQWKESGLGTIG